MNDYGMGEFFKKSFDFQQSMTKAWMDTMTGASGEKTDGTVDPLAAVTGMYKNLYDSWQKQFIDNPWMKMTPWNYNMFNTENAGFDIFNKMMNSGKSLNDLSGLWQQLLNKDPFASREEILKFLEDNKASYEKLIQDFLKPFVPEAMRPLMDNAMGLVREYEGISSAVIKPWLELTPQSVEDFKKMKPTACLINTSRGRVIDEEALARALDEGLIGGAMLDVIAEEPPTYGEKIFNCKNAHVTPHVSYISEQSFEELKRRAVNNAIMGMEGGISPDLVNG